MKKKNPVLFGIGIGLVLVFGYAALQAASSEPEPAVDIKTTIPPVQPTAALPVMPLEETAWQPSPDGKVKLTMRVTHQLSGISDYVFTASDGSGENAVDVYTASLGDGKFRIPFNTWSPDDKYFFIEKDTGEAYVFTRDGTPITATEQYLDVKTTYSAVERPHAYRLVTGWASPTLLIINTITPEDKKGSSFWFEVPSKALIQLWGDF